MKKEIKEKRMKKTKLCYKVCIMGNSYHYDGNGVLAVYDCGHKHRTLSDAVRCYRALTKTYPCGTRPAKWAHAEIRHIDGAPLSPVENERRVELICNQSHSF